MSPEPSARERRRNDRVVLRIPITIFGMNKDNQHISLEAETADISRGGALLLSSNAFRPGTILEITSKFTKQCEKFRVVWSSDQQKHGNFEVGIEMLTPRDDFWGITFPSRPTPLKL
jgi:c-di-GMP-binding flagellar brake protein YcgR